MKKTALTLGSVVFLMAVFVSPVLALEIEVDQQGNIKMYEGYVLGKTTDRPSIQPISAPSSNTRPATAPRTPTKYVPTQENKDLVVTMEESGPQVQLRDSSGAGSRGAAGETMMSDNLEMRFPARTKELSEEQREKMSEYQQKIQEARQERIQEMVELRERNMGEAAALEIRTRNIKAHLNGAEFVLDSKNNEVKLTTPSGQEHILTHLPDQALARMKEAGVLTDSSFDPENDELEAVATEDGIQYVADVVEEKKLFSFFPRMVERKIILDDATGEVTQDYASQGWFARMLDRFSY